MHYLPADQLFFPPSTQVLQKKTNKNRKFLQYSIWINGIYQYIDYCQVPHTNGFKNFRNIPFHDWYVYITDGGSAPQAFRNLPHVIGFSSHQPIPKWDQVRYSRDGRMHQATTHLMWSSAQLFGCHSNDLSDADAIVSPTCLDVTQWVLLCQIRAVKADGFPAEHCKWLHCIW